MEKAFNEKKAKFVSEQEENGSKLRMEFKETYELMNKRYSMLLSKYEELVEIFEKRPSKDEDLELIAKLKEELRLKANQMSGFEEDMEFYKNQLINMDETYTKYFGNTHKVGNLNPLELNKKGSFNKGKDQKGFNFKKN